MFPEYFSFEELQEEIRQYQERQDEASLARMDLPRSLADSISAGRQAGVSTASDAESPIL
jgi:hypothetical protein